MDFQELGIAGDRDQSFVSLLVRIPEENQNPWRSWKGEL